MMPARTGNRVLSLYPNVSGLCYALFESELRPVDWGIKTARRNKHATVMRHANNLTALFSPATIILPARHNASNSYRLQRIAIEIERLSVASGIAVHWHSRMDIKACFGRLGAQSKDAIATAIARLMPELDQHLPPVRKLWMSEDYRMGLFDAVALAVTHHHQSSIRDVQSATA